MGGSEAVLSAAKTRKILIVICAALLGSLALVTAHRAAAQNSDAVGAQNQNKARATLDAMTQAMGGQRWLSIATTMQQGRTAGFYQGKPTGSIADYTELRRFPDQSRMEIGKKHDIIEMFAGTQGWEITYKGKKPIPPDQVEDYIRRRSHSIEVALRIWMRDPKTILIYDGQNLVERHLADQVTLINGDNDSITIEMDAETHLPLRRSWQWRDPLYKDMNKDAEEYDDYHVVQGIPTAFSITRFHNGDMTDERFVYRVAYNVPLPPDAFNPDKTATMIAK